MRGIFEFEIDGVKRGFYFNFNALGIVEENTGEPIDEIIKQLNDKKKPKVKLLANMFYAGALNYCDFRNIEPDFTIHDVGDWISEVGLVKAAELIKGAINVQTPKNSSPLQAEGMKVNGQHLNTTDSQ